MYTIILVEETTDIKRKLFFIFIILIIENVRIIPIHPINSLKKTLTKPLIRIYFWDFTKEYIAIIISEKTVVIAAPLCLKNLIKTIFNKMFTAAAIIEPFKTYFSLFFIIKIPLQNILANTETNNPIDKIFNVIPASI